MAIHIFNFRKSNSQIPSGDFFVTYNDEAGKAEVYTLNDQSVLLEQILNHCKAEKWADESTMIVKETIQQQEKSTEEKTQSERISIDKCKFSIDFTAGADALKVVFRKIGYEAEPLVMSEPRAFLPEVAERAIAQSIFELWNAWNKKNSLKFNFHAASDNLIRKLTSFFLDTPFDSEQPHDPLLISELCEVLELPSSFSEALRHRIALEGEEKNDPTSMPVITVDELAQLLVNLTEENSVEVEEDNAEVDEDEDGAEDEGVNAVHEGPFASRGINKREATINMLNGFLNCLVRPKTLVEFRGYSEEVAAVAVKREYALMIFSRAVDICEALAGKSSNNYAGDVSKLSYKNIRSGSYYVGLMQIFSTHLQHYGLKLSPISNDTHRARLDYQYWMSMGKGLAAIIYFKGNIPASMRLGAAPVSSYKELDTLSPFVQFLQQQFSFLKIEVKAYRATAHPAPVTIECSFGDENTRNRLGTFLGLLSQRALAMGNNIYICSIDHYVEELQQWQAIVQSGFAAARAELQQRQQAAVEAKSNEIKSSQNSSESAMSTQTDVTTSSMGSETGNDAVESEAESEPELDSAADVSTSSTTSNYSRDRETARALIEAKKKKQKSKESSPESADKVTHESSASPSLN